MPDQERDEAFHFAGDRLGKFVILGELGRGSMGVVYEAFQEDLKRKVALKILPGNISLDIKQVRRFKREAESVARLRHDNVIQIYEVGQIDNTHYFAMEMVDGDGFGSTSFIRDRAYIDDAARIIRDAARGLAHAHERGVIHRDIKPSNLLIDRDKRVVVTDFGLARLSESTSLTSTDAIVGTPKYMAPEQILPGTYPLDGRCDLYGLGATLYEAVCGDPPIDGPSVQAFLKAILEERPVWPRKRNRLVPHDLSTIIMRCLEKHPGERYKNADELANDLDRYLNGERILAKPKGLAARGLSFVARHKVVSTLSLLAFIGAVVALVLTLQVQTKAEIARLLATDDEDLPTAITEAEVLRQEHPRDPEVREAYATLLRRQASVLLTSPQREIRTKFPVILDLLERAGGPPDFWRVMLLFECDRDPGAPKTTRQTARELLDSRKLPSALEGLVRANFALLDGDYERALEALGPAPGDQVPAAQYVYYHLLKASAERALKDNEAARASIQMARAVTSKLSQPWLVWRVDTEWIDLKEIGTSAARLDAFLEVFREAADRTAALLSNLARLSEDMSSEERRIAEAFIERVLEQAEVETGIASDLISTGAQRIQEGRTSGDPRKLAFGHLVHAIGLLASGDTQGARDDLAQADDLQAIDDLRPYVHWAWSLTYRVERDIENALKETFYAFDFAEFTKLDKGDLDLMVKHLLAVWDLADGKLREGFRDKLERLQQQALVERLASLFPPTDGN